MPDSTPAADRTPAGPPARRPFRTAAEFGGYCLALGTLGLLLAHLLPRLVDDGGRDGAARLVLPGMATPWSAAGIAFAIGTVATLALVYLRDVDPDPPGLRAGFLRAWAGTISLLAPFAAGLLAHDPLEQALAAARSATLPPAGLAHMLFMYLCLLPAFWARSGVMHLARRTLGSPMVGATEVVPAGRRRGAPARRPAAFRTPTALQVGASAGHFAFVALLLLLALHPLANEATAIAAKAPRGWGAGLAMALSVVAMLATARVEGGAWHTGVAFLATLFRMTGTLLLALAVVAVLSAWGVTGGTHFALLVAGLVVGDAMRAAVCRTMAPRLMVTAARRRQAARQGTAGARRDDAPLEQQP